MTQKRPFVPRNKPKSWCIGIISGMVGLLIAGPIMFAGEYLNVGLVKPFGIFIFVGCILTFFLMWLVFMIGLASGKYGVVEDKDWKEQVW